MRTLSGTLLAKQKEREKIVPCRKVTLTRAGYTSYTYYATDRLLEIVEHIEEPWSQQATFILSNHDKGLNGIDLTGYKAVLSYGYHTASGDEYSDAPPLWIIPQEYASVPGALQCSFKAIGIMDLLGYDEASALYRPNFTEADDAPTDPATGDYWRDTNETPTPQWRKWNGTAWVVENPPTIKGLIDAILGATHASYTTPAQCKAWTVTYDSTDSLINTFMPMQKFRIYVKTTRLQCLKNLLALCGCEARAGGDGTIHIFVPTVSGMSYNYTYKLGTDVGDHNWRSKTHSNRLILPNRVYVMTYPDAYVSYAGEAYVTGYAGLPDEVKKTMFVQVPLSSNAEGASLAAAILAKLQLNTQMGSAVIPIDNVGAEVLDYVKIEDSREGVNAIGNIGRLVRRWKPGRDLKNPAVGTLEFTLGWDVATDVLDFLMGVNDQIASYENLYVKNFVADQINLVTMDTIGDGTTWGKLLKTHIDAGGVKVSALTTFASGYNPITKFDPALHTLDNIPNGVISHKVSSAALTATGLVVLDEVYVNDDTGGLPLGDFTAAAVSVSALGITGGIFAGTITSITDAGSGQVNITCYGHGMVTGDYALIVEADSYNGRYPITKVDANNFKITATYVGVETSGYAMHVQAFMASADGKFYCGAGAVTLDEDGITIEGENFYLKDQNGATRGWIRGFDYGSNGALAIIAPATADNNYLALEANGTYGGVGQDIVISASRAVKLSNAPLFLAPSASPFADVLGYSQLYADTDGHLYFKPYGGSAVQCDGGGSGAVTSVFGRTGAVVAQSGDYASYYLGLTATATDSDKLDTYHAGHSYGQIPISDNSANPYLCAGSLEGRKSGHGYDQIPISDSTLCPYLNAGLLGGYPASSFLLTWAQATDSDKLDGEHKSYYAVASHTHSYFPLSGGNLQGSIGPDSTSYSRACGWSNCYWGQVVANNVYYKYHGTFDMEDDIAIIRAFKQKDDGSLDMASVHPKLKTRQPVDSDGGIATEEFLNFGDMVGLSHGASKQLADKLDTVIAECNKLADRLAKLEKAL